MRNYLEFALPDFDDTETTGVISVLRSAWITTGTKTREFERHFANLVCGKQCIAVNSCTAAMHLGLGTIEVREGDEVITSPYTFAATAEVIRYFGAKPAFVDVSPDDLNINPVLIALAVTEQTKAIIPVHVAGLPCELDTIAMLAAGYGVTIIEDAAHAFPARYRHRKIGQGVVDNQDYFTCFSFYATKTITTGEGGMIATNNEKWAERCRIMSLHGISKDAWKRYSAEGSWYYEIIAPGYKYNMTDIAAAIGLAQLAKADRMWARRKYIAERYNQAFREMPELQIPHDREDCQHAWHLYMLRLHLDGLSIDRAEFIEEMKRRGIGTSVHFIPLHIHPYYRETYGYKPMDFPVAYTEYLREVSLPIYSKMSDEDIERVIAAVIDVVAKNRQTSAAFKSA